MAKQLKIKIKNTQLAKAAGLGKVKAKTSKKQESEKKPKTKPEAEEATAPEATEEKPRRIKARKKSAFAQTPEEQAASETPAPEETAAPIAEQQPEAPAETTPPEEKTEAPEPAPEEKPAEPAPKKPKKPVEKLGPTGRHIKDILPPKKEKPPAKQEADKAPAESKDPRKKGKKVRELKDLKPRRGGLRTLGGQGRKGMGGDDERWRKKRPSKQSRSVSDEPVIRPSSLKIRLPILVKDLASEMKLKAAELVQKLFLQGMAYTLNDPLDDETTVQFLGAEFGCEISVDTSEEERIAITSQSIKEEIVAADSEKLALRAPVVAFMGHVDHGKTSLIDAIRKSNLVSGESGAITQHIGAFRCNTPVGDLTVLDTPGHEAFSAMRARGAEVTDIVVLVVAGDEGMRTQTLEAVEHAKAAGVTIVVAINKSDKPNFNPDNVYRELSEVELLPEAWGGQTITINTSAVSGEGIKELLEMLALQAEVLELRADPTNRARGTVLESEMHKGLGSVATVLVQNGTLRQGDALVFERFFGRVKTMHDEHGKLLSEAGPSTPIEITGLSGLPDAGEEFVAVANEKEAREIAEARAYGLREKQMLQKKAANLESIMMQQHEKKGPKKTLKLLLRADVQGSVEALQTSLSKIHSDKVDVDIIFTGVGEISESDVQLAAASDAVILGFHTRVESHAESLIKEMGVKIRLHDVIYHAIDDVKDLMKGLLDKLAEEKEQGAAHVKATFKASQLGIIAGCQVTEGVITRNSLVRLVRDGEIIWKGSIASLKREKEDVREVKKGLECGILLAGNNDVQAEDEIQAYEIIYITQEI